MIRWVVPRSSGYAIQRVRFFGHGFVVRKAIAFDMPAMSPTMTEGGIVQWQVRQGDSYAAGDVLLEIETDKAQIAVEAQEDGIMAKILVEDGAKEIKVGTPIAVIADPGDDISSIDFASVISSAKPAAETQSQQPEKSEQSSSSSEPEAAARSSPVEIPQNTVLLPSVHRLVHQFEVDISKIKGTGPQDRILKGDVLAAVGKIPPSWPAEEAKLIEKREHLNLDYEPAAATLKQEVTKPNDLPKDLPKPVVTQTTIDLAALFEFSADQGFNLDQTIAKASRLAIRDSLLASKPKPSVLRDKIFDSLTAPKPTVPFDVTLKVLKKKAVPKVLQATVSIPPQFLKRGQKMGDIYLERLGFYLNSKK